MNTRRVGCTPKLIPGFNEIKLPSTWQFIGFDKFRMVYDFIPDTPEQLMAFQLVGLHGDFVLDPAKDGYQTLGIVTDANRIPYVAYQLYKFM